MRSRHAVLLTSVGVLLVGGWLFASALTNRDPRSSYCIPRAEWSTWKPPTYSLESGIPAAHMAEELRPIAYLLYDARKPLHRSRVMAQRGGSSAISKTSGPERGGSGWGLLFFCLCCAAVGAVPFAFRRWQKEGLAYGKLPSGGRPVRCDKPLAVATKPKADASWAARRIAPARETVATAAEWIIRRECVSWVLGSASKYRGIAFLVTLLYAAAALLIVVQMTLCFGMNGAAPTIAEVRANPEYRSWCREYDAELRMSPMQQNSETTNDICRDKEFRKLVQQQDNDSRSVSLEKLLDKLPSLVWAFSFAALSRNSIDAKQGGFSQRTGFRYTQRFARQRTDEITGVARISGLPTRDQRTRQDAQALGPTQARESEAGLLWLRTETGGSARRQRT